MKPFDSLKVNAITKQAFLFVTRMHSSRMRTARFNGHLYWGWGEVSGVCVSGGEISRGFPGGRVSRLGVVSRWGSPDPEADTPLDPEADTLPP